MIKKARRDFIFICMISLVSVIAIIMISINAINYSNVSRDADDIIEILLNNNGRFPPRKEPFLGDKGSPEMPYETRYFAVSIEDGVLKWTNMGSIVAISNEEAVAMANSVLKGKSTKGYQGIYRYGVQGSLIIFVDCQKNLRVANSFLKSSIIISVCGLIGVFGLVWLGSKWVIHPLVLSEQKQKEFITNSNHELKTPLAIIQANTELLEIENADNEWLLGIKKQVAKLTELTSSLTSLARMNETNYLLEKATFSMTDALMESVSGMKGRLENQNKDLVIDIDEVTYEGNEQKLRELFSILSDNACKYSISFVHVSLKKEKSRIVFEIENDVNEISDGNHEELFERFYRLDKSRQTQGFGIGLSIAKAIIDCHKAKATILANKNILTFRIIF